MDRSPYDEALRWIEAHPLDPSALGLAKLVLSICYANCCFGVRECTEGLDDYRMAIALRVFGAYARFGEDTDLTDAGRAVAERYPELLEIAMAGDLAKAMKERELQATDAAMPP